MIDYTIEQERIELDCIDEGINKYNEAISARPLSELTAGQRAIQGIMTNMVVGIEEAQETWLTGKPLHRGRYIGPIISGIPAPELALVTLSTIYNIAFEGCKYTYAAGAIGKQVDRYLQSQQMKDKNYSKYKQCISKYKNINDRKYKKILQMFDGDIESLQLHQRMHVGIFLLNVAIKYTDNFNYYCVFKNGKRSYHFNIKTEVREQIEQSHEDLAILHPIYKPMVVPPKDWTTIDDGGYLYLQQTAIKETVGLNAKTINNIRGDSVNRLLPYLNLLQKTQWKINVENLEVLEKVMELGGGVAGLPRLVPYPFPPKPYDIDTNSESLANWKAEAALVYTKNAKLAGQNVLLNAQRKLAAEFAPAARIFYPWSADWRLRSYPSCNTVSPQSSDLGKSLLRFGTGIPLGKDGFKWLSVTLCNNIGHDKVSFSDRLEYVLERRETIERCVQDPIHNQEWMRWDEPFRGLACAREWVEAVNDRENFTSHIPAAVDGTCNGFQHYAALGRDPIVGRYTNLVASDVPDSIYTHVANAAIIINERNCNELPFRDEQGDILPCFAWQGNIGKPLVKQPTMTTPYSVTSSGVMDQIYDNIDLSTLRGNRIKNLHYARDLVRAAIREVATSASDIMEWLRAVAKISAKENKNLVWTSPLQVKIVQRYPKFSESAIYTEFHRVYWRDARKDDKEEISPYKHCNGIAPNFIHSLDAAHMMMTMKAAHDELGVTDFCMVHDSYGVHAGYMERFHQIIREQFVELHRTNWLAHLAEEVSQYLDTEIPEPPSVGTLDIEEVLNSPFLFH